MEIIDMQEFESWDKKKLGIMSYENELWTVSCEL